MLKEKDCFDVLRAIVNKLCSNSRKPKSESFKLLLLKLPTELSKKLKTLVFMKNVELKGGGSDRRKLYRIKRIPDIILEKTPPSSSAHN